ncbi:PREDICTED: ATP-dependent RNA helicase DDX55-like [Amphimedon queenslandica]|uniref:ATP-dependent RNA helicase n=1 Tax=Amphimedon queenslandica TaxID=400682 RepID=A0A1X7V302_AMPQE|nr:PREDICTED: ATP-dependent RNA helicase DDX55-like [Amphimedon queenslandica]|eukprot:XP_011403344.1 PREDICTED: ATP-dependent RNA helicase DDX55-like [Amphimedon queenslandica]
MASTWEEINPSLSPQTLSVLRDNGFFSPTPVQSLVLPHFLSNKDVSVQAVTGSGKTLSFVIPVIEKLKKRKQKWRRGETGAIVILPTRELAVQVSEVFNLFITGAGISLRQLIGGSQEVVKDVRLINEEGGIVVVATPGRLADLLERKDCHLAAGVRSLEILILDEADRLLDLGFEATLNTILSYLPKQRRTGLFSATLRHEVEMLIRSGLRHPVNITLSSESMESTVPDSLINYYIEVPPKDKLSHLVGFLSHHETEKLLVFYATCAGVSYFSDLIKRLLPSLKVLALHGKMREKRQSLFESFMDMESGVLMCTDVMARGIDIPDVDWVLQFDPPSSEKAFIHRCGRTARMGRRGHSLTYLVPPSELAYVEYMRISEGVTLELLPETEIGRIPSSSALIERARAELSKEREFYDKSVRAFVSFVRFYSKHSYHLIFNMKVLDLVSLAYGTFALLHLPKMPELKGKDTSQFEAHPISLEAIPFKERSREKQALALKRKKEAAWMAKAEARKKFLKRKNREERRISRKNTRQNKHTFSASELDELAKEARLVKQYKARKISKEDLEAQLDS